MIIDGRAIATEMLAEVRARLTRTALVRAVVVAPSAATESYLSIKVAQAQEAGMQLAVERLPDNASAAMVQAAVAAPGADAVIVQLPLPPHLEERAILDAIPLAKDADVLSTEAYARFIEDREGALLPPVVASVKEILERAQVSVAGKSVAVVGQGRLVGRPVAAWLVNQGAEVAVITRESGDLAPLKDAAVIISGAGSPGLIRPEHLSDGAVLIDAGTSEQSGAIVGDADPAAAAVASVFTPVPGGVGPIAVACLFRNVSLLLASPLQEA